MKILFMNGTEKNMWKKFKNAKLLFLTAVLYKKKDETLSYFNKMNFLGKGVIKIKGDTL